MADDIRRQALQVNKLLYEGEGGCYHGLRGDELHGRSVGDMEKAIGGLTVAISAKTYTTLC